MTRSVGGSAPAVGARRFARSAGSASGSGGTGEGGTHVSASGAVGGTGAGASGAAGRSQVQANAGRSAGGCAAQQVAFAAGFAAQHLPTFVADVQHDCGAGACAAGVALVGGATERHAHARRGTAPLAAVATASSRHSTNRTRAGNPIRGSYTPRPTSVNSIRAAPGKLARTTVQGRAQPTPLATTAFAATFTCFLAMFT